MQENRMPRDESANEADTFEREPRWPVLVALLAIGGLYAALPPRLAVIPNGLITHRCTRALALGQVIDDGASPDLPHCNRSPCSARRQYFVGKEATVTLLSLLQYR